MYNTTTLGTTSNLYCCESSAQVRIRIDGGKPSLEAPDSRAVPWLKVRGFRVVDSRCPFPCRTRNTIVDVRFNTRTRSNNRQEFRQERDCVAKFSADVE